MKNKSRFLAAISLFLISLPAGAEVSSLVAVEGTVGNLNNSYVELLVANGVTIRVPRSSVQVKEEDLRPEKLALAIVQADKIQLIPKASR